MRARVLRRLLVSLAAGAVGLELALRLVLFGPEPLQRLAPALRHARHFTSPLEQDYWTLGARLGHSGQHPRDFDPLLGWRSTRMLADGTHRDAEHLGPRRPVLLFGDSFADCVTPAVDCFEGLAAAAPWSGSAGLLNYGVSGFGLDQIYLCLRAALPRWAARDPVAVVSVYVGDDLNRCSLDMRAWPKPRFALDGDGLILHRPVESTPRDWAAAHPLPAGSYVARWIRHGSKWFGPPDHPPDELREVCRRLVLSTRGELDAAGVPYFFLLLPGKHDLSRDEAFGWQERLLLETLEAEGIPYETARTDFAADRAASGRPVADYFGVGHYNALGNRVAFRALERGLLGVHAGERDGQ